MAAITTRQTAGGGATVKGSPLTNTEVDNNFINLNVGKVDGPASSTDNAIARFDATTGRLLQDSSVTIADNGAITAPSVGSIIPFYFATYASFPSASTYHGAVAHAHDTGKMYFAHGGNWNALANAPTGTSSQLLANDGSSGFANITLGSGLSLSSGTLTAAGGGSSGPIFESPATLSTSYTLAAGANAGSFGAVILASGISVTVGTGQKWNIFRENFLYEQP
jgi:hypothetical protein